MGSCIEVVSGGRGGQSCLSSQNGKDSFCCHFSQTESLLAHAGEKVPQSGLCIDMAKSDPMVLQLSFWNLDPRRKRNIIPKEPQYGSDITTCVTKSYTEPLTGAPVKHGLAQKLELVPIV